MFCFLFIQSRDMRYYSSRAISLWHISRYSSQVGSSSAWKVSGNCSGMPLKAALSMPWNAFSDTVA